MRKTLTEKLWELITADCEEQNQPVLWDKPLVGISHARDPYFQELREIIRPDHHLPQDFLPEAETVVSWFVPFLPEIGKNNRGGDMPSAQWADAYNITNAMAVRVNEKLCQWVRSMPGQDAAVPFDAGMLGKEIPWSLWSQRHIARLAGLGTFGLNNMLITDKGCVGRCFSIVTTLPMEADTPPEEERCLYKRNGTCGICIRNCPVGALTESGFDRYKCMTRLNQNQSVRGAAASVCGKCLVGLPCSHKNPINK